MTPFGDPKTQWRQGSHVRTLTIWRYFEDISKVRAVNSLRICHFQKERNGGWLVQEVTKMTILIEILQKESACVWTPENLEKFQLGAQTSEGETFEDTEWLEIECIHGNSTWTMRMPWKHWMNRNRMHPCKSYENHCSPGGHFGAWKWI